MKEGQLVAMVGHDNPACVPAFRAMRGVVKRAYPDGPAQAQHHCGGRAMNLDPLTFCIRLGQWLEAQAALAAALAAPKGGK